MEKVLRENDFEDEDEYIRYLKTNGLISGGCALCMELFGVCDKAVEKYKEEDFIEDMPFSYMDADEMFPVFCLVEWYGHEYINRKMTGETEDYYYEFDYDTVYEF